MTIPYDKKLHFGAGVLISCLFGWAFYPLIGLQLALVAGLMKEIRDWCVYRGFDIADMFATWLGGVVGYFIIEAIIK